MSAQQAADAAGISKARWSQVENGYEKKPDGLYYPVHASDGLLARMADAIGLSADRLASEGDRPDAAAVLREMERRSSGDPAPDHEDLTPQCRFETEIANTPGGTPEAKRAMILGHRLNGHSTWCGPYSQQSAPADQQPALRSAI